MTYFDYNLKNYFNSIKIEFFVDIYTCALLSWTFFIDVSQYLFVVYEG